MPVQFKKLILYILIAIGLALSINLFIYCWKLMNILGSPVSLLFITYLIICLALQLIFVWYLYCNFHEREIPDSPPGLSVDVFVTAYNEPLWVVEKTLTAALHIRYPHRTYLLDDSNDSAYKELAERLGSEYITRSGNHNAKAGNINNALRRTFGDFVAMFDADHVPEPDFLDRTLGFFRNPRIGFVQAMITFYNQNENLIARASAESAMEYFNISLVCKDRIGAACLHGTNAVIRRTALESIGGYQPGLAEDLETSIPLHAKGWESAYVYEPLAPGLVPATYIAFCKQHLKWSRGVFEAAWRSVIEGSFFHLTWHQRIAYAVRFSYYLIGLTFLVGMISTLFFLNHPLIGEGFYARILPLTALTMIIRWAMLRMWAKEPAARKGFHFKGASIVISTWPLYIVSLICTLMRIRIPFISTPKDSRSELKLSTIVPQMIMIITMMTGIIWKVFHWHQGPALLALLFSFLILVQHWMLFVAMGENIMNKEKVTTM